MSSSSWQVSSPAKSVGVAQESLAILLLREEERDAPTDTDDMHREKEREDDQRSHTQSELLESGPRRAKLSFPHREGVLSGNAQTEPSLRVSPVRSPAFARQRGLVVPYPKADTR